MSVITRFAPSPSGLLHLGHAYSAWQAWQFACQHEGQFILRIEDIDFNRCKREFEDGIKEDLHWLGMRWQEPTRRQSDHFADFHAIAEQLKQQGVLYPCFCTRKEILAEIERSGAAPHGSEGPVYPGTCRNLSEDEAQARIAEDRDHAWRLDLQAALARVGDRVLWVDQEVGSVQVGEAEWPRLGDVVLVRKDIGTSYHVAVVADDHLQEVTHIIRGRDLYESTHVHALLQDLLNFNKPIYQHHDLIADESGKRLAKRNEAKSLQLFREQGLQPEDVIKRLVDSPIEGG